MAKEARKTLTDDGYNRMEPNFLSCVERGDIQGAKSALYYNPNCILDTDMKNLNALQIAIVEFHSDMAVFLLEETEISAQHKDELDRDALHLAIQYGGEEVAKKVNKRWCEEQYKKHKAEQNKIVPFTPTPK